MGKFIIKKTATGCRFVLNAANGETVAASEVYATEAACRRGIESVKRSSGKAGVEDTTEPVSTVSNPKFQLFADKSGQYRFRLRSRNGQVIAVSEGYTTKAACLGGIQSVRQNAADAEVEKEDAT